MLGLNIYKILLFSYSFPHETRREGGAAIHVKATEML
jgi:hypothetical protein